MSAIPLTIRPRAIIQRAVALHAMRAGLLVLCTHGLPGTASADWTSKLEPRTRAMQVCSLAGLNAFARDKKLKPRPDRVQINASGDPKVEPSLVTGNGAAVRSGGRWYAFKFTCKLNDTGTKAAAFSYDLGAEIPKAQWEKLGLWQ